MTDIKDHSHQGLSILKEALSTMSQGPGVYRMLGAKGVVLYVGKAKNLKKRLESYVRGVYHSAYMAHCLEQLHSLEVTLVSQEADALILEASLIQSLKPRYNVLLKSNQTFPYIFIDIKNHSFPRLSIFRGSCKKNGLYFGPFTQISILQKAIDILEKMFLLRSCADHVFSNRSRPCLLYQIKRCSAPCVGEITQGNYQVFIDQARKFFSGENNTLKNMWKNELKKSVKEKDFKKAIHYRDLLQSLEKISLNTGKINPTTFAQADLFACAIDQEKSYACIQVFFFRSYQNLGNFPYFFKIQKGMKESEILSSFIPQFYKKNSPPKLILSHSFFEDQKLIEVAFNTKVIVPKKGEKKNFTQQAFLNACEALKKKTHFEQEEKNYLQDLVTIFKLPLPFPHYPERIEIYDNSHIQGNRALGVMVVYQKDGFVKNDYRIFNMKEEHKGNDLSMMREVFLRRFHTKNTHQKNPDLILIDGGLTQVRAAQAVLKEKNVDIPLIGIAKGKERNAGKERFFLPDGSVILLQEQTPLMHFLQRLRDEAHRFAINAHRRRRLREEIEM